MNTGAVQPPASRMTSAVCPGARPRFLDRQRIIAPPDFNRWLIPPAALAVHLSIGTAYGFSVFLQPLSHVLGIVDPRACSPALTLWRALFTTGCDWRVSDVGWIYTLFFVFLGTAAALWGGWLERAGPRKAGLIAAACWSGGQLIAALGVATHQLWLLWVGFGPVGGVGLGLGYILPVSTLMKWFPDRRGIAGGMAVMGFGGGAMIGAPLSNLLMTAFKGPASVGVWQTLVVLAGIYALAMASGALSFRLPPLGWSPGSPRPMSSTRGSVHVSLVHRTRQFWLLWSILCLNVSAGIGMLGLASLMLQEVFGGQLIGLSSLTLARLSVEQRATTAAIAAGFTGLLSFFNIGGRLFWAALSDRIGRKPVFYCFSVFGIVLYAATPALAHAHDMVVFAGVFCILISMFGGAFATMPAYVADIFGPAYVGAIQGRVLTAWSVAGVVGPVLLDYMREAELSYGVPAASAYDVTMYVLAGLLALALLANAAVRPLDPRWFTPDAGSPTKTLPVIPVAAPIGSGRSATVQLTTSWLLVGGPLAWGAWMTVTKTFVLFGLKGMAH